MTSAYDKMTVTSERIAKHLGGTSSSMNGIEFDNDFFKGKFVILFDDIVTKGNSMLAFKRKMEELGAIVVMWHISVHLTKFIYKNGDPSKICIILQYLLP